MQLYYLLQLPLILVGGVVQQIHWLLIFGRALLNHHTCFVVSAKYLSDEQLSL